jgi:hopanoid biosynthesis associated radical SAM protein HpnH
MWSVASYLLHMRLRGEQRFPLVLMLEPLYRCNLACTGCGKIQYPAKVLRHELSLDECLCAVDECRAPVVTIPGGEPLLYSQIEALVEALVARRKFIYLCTNALLLEEKLPRFTPSPYLSFSVHLDGLEEEHDAAVDRPGTHRIAVRAIRAALAAGFRVTTNTTLFEGADPERVRAHFDAMMELGVEGMMVSPGYAYEAAPDREHFLGRERTRDLFRQIFARGSRRWRFNQSPLFLEFLMGSRDYDCTPWAMPSYGVFGWQRPCYLLQEGYAKSYAELIQATTWKRYGHASGNPSCANCMMHSGFEGSAVADTFSSWRSLAAAARAALLGPRAAPPRTSALPARAESAAPARPAAVALRGESRDATPEALAAAFHYRGDVTLELADGSRVEGFVSNLTEREVELWLRNSAERRVTPRNELRRVVFSGRDRAAAGRDHLTRRAGSSARADLATGIGPVL